MMAQKLLTLSDLRVIGPVQINPNAAEAMKVTEKYCRQLGIMGANFREYCTMSAYLFPRASLERLIAIDLLNNLLFFIDDTITEGRADSGYGQRTLDLFNMCVRIIRDGYTPPHTNPIFETCKVLHPMLQKLATPGLQKRMVKSLERHFWAATHNIDAIMVNGVINIPKYIEVREHDSGMHPTLDLLELSCGIYLPDEVIAEPTMYTLRECTIRIGCLMNDIFSYEKEVLQRGQRFNLINVLREAHDLSFEEAVHQSVLIVNELVDTFVQKEAALPDWGDPKLNQWVAQYTEGLRDQIIATWQWQMATNRYRSMTSPFPELRLALAA
jgi:hypothetical protein